MHKLVLHPQCAPGPITSVSAKIEPTATGCHARFRFAGDIGRVKVPEHAPAQRKDFLWQTTCFEIFWQPDGGTWYRELNLSPSSRWACYDFDDFRLNSRDGPVEAIAVACAYNAHELVLEASISSNLVYPAQVALNGIVEDVEGNIQFWALAFPDGKPEFHSEVCRKVRLGAGA